jgi:hypothetical protein
LWQLSFISNLSGWENPDRLRVPWPGTLNGDGGNTNNNGATRQWFEIQTGFAP